MNEEYLCVQAEYGGERLDKYISAALGNLSRSSVQKLIEDGQVTVNSVYVTKSIKVKPGDNVCVIIPEPQELKAEPQDIPIEIVYEDSDLLVVNKPKGMVVHPAAGNPDGTLVNALLFHCKGRLSSINGVIRPGIVHRIDKDTSGLLAVAKTDAAHAGLAAQIKEHSFRREYRAIVCGHMPENKSTVNVPLGRSSSDRKKQAPNGKNPRDAVTHYEVIEPLDKFDYCKFILETGRTHQIRVHCSYLGHPIAGDTVYGSAKNDFGLHGQCLHAAVLGFIHPVSGEYLEFSAPLPEWFTDFMNKHKLT